MAESSVSVKLDERQMRRVQSLLREVPREVPKIMSRALNRTGTSTKAEVARIVAAVAKIPVKGVKKGIWMKKATRRRWLATLNVTSRRIPLIYLKAGKTKKGVTYRGPGDVYAHKQKVEVSGGLIRSAFKQAMPGSGHKGVFLRRIKKRLPIDELFGPSPAELFEGVKGIAKQVMRSANEKLTKNIDSQINYVLEKRKAG